MNSISKSLTLILTPAVLIAVFMAAGFWIAYRSTSPKPPATPELVKILPTDHDSLCPPGSAHRIEVHDIDLWPGTHLTGPLDFYSPNFCYKLEPANTWPLVEVSPIELGYSGDDGIAQPLNQWRCERLMYEVSPGVCGYALDSVKSSNVARLKKPARKTLNTRGSLRDDGVISMESLCPAVDHSFQKCPVQINGTTVNNPSLKYYFSPAHIESWDAPDGDIKLTYSNDCPEGSSHHHLIHHLVMVWQYDVGAPNPWTIDNISLNDSEKCFVNEQFDQWPLLTVPPKGSVNP